MNQTEKTVWDLSTEAVESEGCFLYLVEFVKEGKDKVLRLLIDSEDGIDIEQCENVSRKVSEILDEADPISESYMLEVSSPGLERKIVLPWHFEMYEGEKIDIGLYAQIHGKKKFSGILKGYLENNSLTVEIDGEDVTFQTKDVATVNLHFEF